jgi:hypothetical protein
MRIKKRAGKNIYITRRENHENTERHWRKRGLENTHNRIKLAMLPNFRAYRDSATLQQNRFF